MVDRLLVYEFYSINVTVLWNKFESIVMRIREADGYPYYLDTVEWFAGEMEKERIIQGPEKVTEYRT